ncbi:MAG TPA: alanine racemase [Acetobacteraceae bacterium]|nr:alanine racemase [Acetobacteraceae bacterium]
MKLSEIPTPALALDRRILKRNIATMAEALARHRVMLRPHLKTAKSIDVARLVLGGVDGAITVSTLAEAEYFAAHGIKDILYAVGITPEKLARVAKINEAGADVLVITDDLDTASAIHAYPAPISTLIEIDSGEGRAGVPPEGPELLAIGEALGPRLAGVITHAGHSYGARDAAGRAAIAKAERSAVVDAAKLLRAAGRKVEIVSMGSSPTALAAATYEGVTEVRAGVYMFGDLFQAEIGTHGPEDIAVTVIASVIGKRPDLHQFLIDAGAIALSKDRSTEATPHDYGFGLVRGLDDTGRFGTTIVRRAYQEHGVVACDPALPFPTLKVGDKVRVAPNHVCLTAAAHDRYFVTDDGETVAAVWPRINGW